MSELKEPTKPNLPLPPTLEHQGAGLDPIVPSPMDHVTAILTTMTIMFEQLYASLPQAAVLRGQLAIVHHHLDAMAESIK